MKKKQLKNFLIIHFLTAITLMFLMSCSSTRKTEKVEESAPKEELEVEKKEAPSFYVSMESDGKNNFLAWVVIDPKKDGKKELTFGMGIVYQSRPGEASLENSTFSTSATTYMASPFGEDQGIYSISMIKNFCGYEKPHKIHGGISTENPVVLKEMEDGLVMVAEGELYQLARSDWELFIKLNSIARAAPCPKNI